MHPVSTPSFRGQGRRTGQCGNSRRRRRSETDTSEREREKERERERERERKRKKKKFLTFGCLQSLRVSHSRSRLFVWFSSNCDILNCLRTTSFSPWGSSRSTEVLKHNYCMIFIRIFISWQTLEIATICTVLREKMLTVLVPELQIRSGEAFRSENQNRSQFFICLCSYSIFEGYEFSAKNHFWVTFQQAPTWGQNLPINLISSSLPSLLL